MIWLEQDAEEGDQALVELPMIGLLATAPADESVTWLPSRACFRVRVRVEVGFRPGFR